MAEHLIEIEKAETNLLDCAAYIAENIKSADGHAAAMKELVPRYLETGAVDLAAELANTVDDPFTRDRLLLRVAEKCAAVGDDEYAFQLVEAIEEKTMGDDARQRIAGKIAGRGDFSRALEIAESLPDPYFAFVEISFHLAAAGDETQAREIIEKIDFSKAKATAFQNLAALQMKNGNTADAVASLEKANAAVDEIEFDEEQIQTRLDIANYFIEAGKMGRAIEIFDAAKASAETLDNVHRESFLGEIALGFLRAGSVELADRTLDLVTDNVQLSSTLVSFAREFWERDEKSEAAETLEEAYSILKSQRDRDVRDSKARFAIWATTAVEFARIEKPERALEIAQEVADENAHNSALAQIAQVCAAQNKDEWARQSVNAVTDDAPKMFALIGVSDVKTEAGKADEALIFLGEAATLAETADWLGIRSNAFDELARRFQRHGDLTKMRGMIFENFDTIFRIRDASDRVSALARMSDFYRAADIELTAPEREMMSRIIAKSNV